ncbi:competence protein ComK [Cytobacillus sp. FSL W7-1323]|uniref:competence protein ComK n=1 Tax=unclassified Cytobacillus TaxID=2675268 RepID=UPI002AFEFD49|nr:competence protein ComK [Cytobacillus sp. OWB-43]MEA1853992.1 competence protein ComK [Cytobacillus sp. OWB-43]
MLNHTDYLLKSKTEALKAINVHNNYIHTQVIEGKNTTFIVEKPPIAIVKDSLREYGMTYKGALQAAKYKLNKKSTPPIRIWGAQDMYWFYFSSQYDIDNTFVSLAHIHEMQPFNKNMTKIILTSGYYFNLSISCNKAKKRWDQARLLRGQIQDSINKQSFVPLMELPGMISEEKEEYKSE